MPLLSKRGTVSAKDQTNLSYTTNTLWPFEIDKCHGWAYSNNVFSKEECEKIIKIGKNKNLKTALINDGKEEKKIRASKINWLYPNKETDWIYRRLTDVVILLNKEYFGFKLFGFTEGLQFTKYEAPSGHYTKHIDKMFGRTIRKLSITVQLSDPKDYEGGELELTFGQKPDIMDKEQGKLIAFPSYALHEVKAVTKGTRYSLVAWITGDAFL
jgi:PKHD-type hydroxylase